MKGGAYGGGGFDGVYPVMRGVVTLAVAAFGTVFAGMISSVNRGNMFFTWMSCILGGLVFFCLGGIATGFWHDILKSIHNDTKDHYLPNSIATMIGRHGHFDLIMTVHEARDVGVRGQLPWQQANLFAEVICGSNPPKCTCVKANGDWQEAFKLHIKPSDEAITLQIKNQDIFGASSVGHVHIPIQRGVVDAGFPRFSKFEVEAGESEWLARKPGVRSVLVVSFDQSPTARNERGHVEVKTAMNSMSYGSVAFLPDLEFNPKIQAPQREPDTA